MGMMLAHAPVVFLGDKFAGEIAMPIVRRMAALIFAILGVLTLLNVGNLFSQYSVVADLEARYDWGDTLER